VTELELTNIIKTLLDKMVLRSESSHARSDNFPTETAKTRKI